MNLDYVNGLFELGMALVILLSINKLRRDKMVHGIHWANIAFPATWGFWNLIYYPSLDQWFSFFGGLAVVIVNMIYLAMIFHYSRAQS